MKCPNCSLINPDTAQRCDCGYDFRIETASPQPGDAKQGKAGFANGSGTRDFGGPQPVGVVILALLYLVGGIIGIIFLGARFHEFVDPNKMKEVEEALRPLGMPPILLMVGFVFLLANAMASGVGMLLGAKWGWWSASFYNAYGMYRHAWALLTVASLAEELEGGSRGPVHYLVKHSGNMVVHGLLFLYLFRRNVLSFFRLRRLSKPRAVGILVGTCLLITVATWLAGMLHERFGG